MRSVAEGRGVILALCSAALWGIFPVMVNRGSRIMPPLTFAAVSTLCAASGSLLYLTVKGRWGELRRKEAYASLLMITLCIVIIPYTLFFTGSAMTSGVNTSVLLLSEIVFTLLFTPLIGEKTTVGKLAGAIGVGGGALLILYNGSFRLNVGDLLIIVSTATYPVGNFYAKKALNSVSAATILFVRFLLGGLFLLCLAAQFEGPGGLSRALTYELHFVLFTGLVLLGAGKILWYEALARLDISKAISLGMTFPVFSLLLLVGVFREPVSSYQWLGISVMAVGVIFSIRRRSVDPAMTKYSPD